MTRRQVNRNHIDAVELHFDVAPLVVELLVAVTANDFLRFVLRIDGNAAIAFLHRVLVVAVIAGRLETLVDQLMFLRLGFLDADNVRIFLAKPLEHAFTGCGANSVRV